MKNTLLTLILVVISSVFSTNVMAADIEAGVVKNVPNQLDIIQDDPFYLSPSDLAGVDIDASILESDFSKKENLAANLNKMGPAPGISYFEIAAVVSVSYPFLDEVLANQFSTNEDHGGGQVRVYVFQFGYGNTNNATFAGSSVAATSSTPRCGSNLSQCSAGQTVTGFLHQFDFFGPTNVSGQVNVSANSIAFPFGFWSDSVFIR
ncbi:DUF4879 domain-containing protein [Agarilytica rhodophyticola]|uniref:DUF4879 domain-containing protein n=1 Tax=Agarilytica rhodophyticola TaxID=1737490 RepID=UPI000B3411E8|nr:DUF4879 domain-containing protein [Agarilytica rhodophyticola]